MISSLRGILKTAIFLSAFLILSGCTIFQSGERAERDSLPEVVSPDNQFTVPGQIVASDRARSIQLHRRGNPATPPIIELNNSRQLQLTFEMLEFDSRQFRITFTHHNPDWSRSPLPPEFFMEGLYTHYIDGGQVSQGTHRPQYRQYQFRFPNDRFSFTRSGNYMLRVEDQDTGYLVFSLPFFVTENRGSIASSVEEITTPKRNLRISHRPVSRFTLPDFVDQPQFDLEFYYVQNQFWSRSRRADELDFSAPGEVRFELTRNRAFIGDYEFLELSLDELSQNNPQVFEAAPHEVPTRLVLMDDISGFSSTGRLIPSSRYGKPDASLTARYANVTFRFEPGEEIEEDEEIYLVGDFNNWSIRSGHRLKHNPEIDRWETSTIIKQGMYNYKYVLMDDGDIDDLYFDDLFLRTPQEYHALIYMRDHQQFYYRLLQVNQFFSGR